MKIAPFCALALTTACSPPSAHAAAIGEEAAPSITVRYGDLDLSRQHRREGAFWRVSMMRRWKAAARPAVQAIRLTYTVVRRSACHADAMALRRIERRRPGPERRFRAANTVSTALASAD